MTNEERAARREEYLKAILECRATKVEIATWREVMDAIDKASPPPSGIEGVPAWLVRMAEAHPSNEYIESMVFDCVSIPYGE